MDSTISCRELGAHFQTEFVACPSCGRTLFDLQNHPSGQRSDWSSQRSNHCSNGMHVHGGEMADADFGYVGCVRQIDLRGKRSVNHPSEKTKQLTASLISYKKKANGSIPDQPHP